MKEGELDAIDECAHFDEIDGRVLREALSGRSARFGCDAQRRRQTEVRMRPSDALSTDPADFADGSVTGKTEDVEQVVHGAEPIPARRSPRAQRQLQLALGAVVERIEIERAVALVAEQFHERWTALFLRRLKLRIGDPQQMHLERLD